MMGRSPEIQKTSPCDCLGYSRKNLEGKAISPSKALQRCVEAWVWVFSISHRQHLWLGVMKR